MADLTTPPTEIVSARPAVQIRAEIARRTRFLITSHAQPDGDSIGSQLALAYALRQLGKDVRLVNRDAAPAHYLAFPGVDQIEIAERVEGDYDALFVMECPDLTRTGLAGLERYFAINIDHHVGNALYGAINWFDDTAAACGELVFELIDGLPVPLTPEIATHIYLTILTDTGAFHHSNMTARTFEICRRTVEAGVDPARMARSVFDSNSYAKLKLIGALLDSMELFAEGRVAILRLDQALLHAAGGTYNDTEGIVNLPLTARDILAVVFFKIQGEQIRVSLRSKGEIDVRSVATVYGGGGHKNASGFTIAGPLARVAPEIIDRVARVLQSPEPGRPR